MPNDHPTIDLDQPILAQIGDLGERYDAWVHRSIKPKGSLRIFRSDFLESLSHIPWWLVLLVWVPITIGLLVLSVSWRHVPVAQVAWLAVLGLFLWTLTEYVLHRFVFHFKPTSAAGRKLHFLAHGIHHLDPWDPQRLVFPPLAGIAIATPIFLGLWAAAGWTAEPLGNAFAMMAGLVVGYMVYDMTHYATHHVKPTSRWGKFLKRYHLAHHHRHPELLFGVSSPLWDLVFRTGYPRA